MSTTPVAPSTRPAAKIGALLATVAGTLYLAWAGFHTRAPVFGTVALIAGFVAVSFLAGSLIVGRRGPLAVRVAGGFADEREKGLFDRALAHAAIAMFIACGYGVVLGLDANGIFVAAAVGFVGASTLGLSALVQSRRSRGPVEDSSGR